MGVKLSDKGSVYYWMAVLLGLVFILLFVFGFFYFSNEKERVRQDKYNELFAVSDLKIAQLQDRQKIRLADAQYLTETEPFLLYIRELVKGDTTHAKLFRENLCSFLITEKYESIFLVDSVGTILLKGSYSGSQYSSSNYSGKFLDSVTVSGVKQVFLTGKYLVNDLFDVNPKGAVYYEFIFPIFDQGGKTIATMVFFIDASKFVFPIINQWTKFQTESESILARKEGDSVRIISQIGNTDNNGVTYIESHKVNKDKCQCKWDSIGSFSGLDLDNNDIIAQYTKIPNSEWYLVEKSYTARVFGQINRKASFTLIIAALILLFCIMALLSLYFNKQQELKQSILASQKEEDEFHKLLIQIRSDLLSFSVKNDLDKTLRHMQDKVGAVTHSPIGFVHFLEADQENISLTAWSTETERQFAPLIGKLTHNPVSSAGVWADAVRTRKPLIHNDFMNVPNRKGLPKGHPALIREIIIPVIKDDKVVSVLGIANKPEPYNSKDVFVASYMADVVWEIAEIKIKEENLRQSEEKYRTFFNDHSAIKMIIDPSNGNIIDANKSAENFYLWPLEQLKKMNVKDISTLPFHELRLFYKKALSSSDPLFEIKQRKANGHLVDVDVYTGVVRIKEKSVIYAIVHDVTLKRYKEKSHDILYNITSKSMGSVSLEQLISIVKQGLSQLLDVSNLFVAMYIPEKDMFMREDFNGQINDFAEWSYMNSLIGYVFRTGKHLLITNKDVESFALDNNLVLSDFVPACWLGVPLISEDRAMGVLVVKSYNDVGAYDSNSLVLMDMVAHELSAAIDRSKMIQDLILAKEKAEVNNRLKSAFLANLSHEVRTPLNAIIGFLDLLSDPDFETEQKESFMKQVKLGSDRLIDTLNNLVKVAEITAGNINVNISAVDVNKLLGEIYEHFNNIVYSKGIELKLLLNVPEESRIVYSDEKKIETVFLNLISNSLKFTQKGTIEFGNYMEGKTMWFYVHDTGCGIDANKLESVFNPFEIVDIELSRKHEGIGLGLSIAKSYIESLGGKIAIESKEGAFTIVRFCLFLS